ncbi:MAG: hypothetical protein AAFR38_05500 [Planctomycetota bacterium]
MTLSAPLIATAVAATLATAGPINPPAGPVAPTGKTTDQIEPRIPLNQETTAGDSAAVFVITRPGSYYLTGVLQADAGRSGVRIESDNVTLDMMGYSILGTPTSPNGIDIADPEFGLLEGLHVRNGHIAGFAETGLDGRSRASVGTLTDITSSNNGEDGIGVNSGFVMTRCIAEDNDRFGFNVNRDCILVDCIARSNSDDGFNVNFINRLDRCHSVLSGGDGFSAGRANRLTNCYAQSNGTAGFRLTVDDCVLIACSAYQNRADFGTTVAGFLVNTNSGENRGRHTLIDCVATENDNGFDVNSTGNFLRGCRATDNVLNNTLAVINFSVIAGNVAPVVTGGSVTASTSAIANISQ